MTIDPQDEDAAYRLAADLVRACLAGKRRRDVEWWCGSTAGGRDGACLLLSAWRCPDLDAVVYLPVDKRYGHSRKLRIDGVLPPEAVPVALFRKRWGTWEGSPEPIRLACTHFRIRRPMDELVADLASAAQTGQPARRILSSSAGVAHYGDDRIVEAGDAVRYT